MESPKNNHFSLILTANHAPNPRIGKYSVMNAVKPLVYFASIFGLKIIKYMKDDIKNIGVLNKGYSLVVILTILTVTAFTPPVSWRYTLMDIPLNIMTKAYGSLHVIEVLYSILSISVIGNRFFVHLLKAFDEIDNHFCVSRKIFYLRIILAFILVLWPFTAMLLSTLFLRPFRVKDMSTYITIFVLLVEGCILFFFVANMYFHVIFFNDVLVKEKVTNGLKKNLIIKRGASRILTRYSSQKRDPYCWFELMKIYDRISDSVYLFNEIYSIQILMMFVIWFMCTLLVICRYLSPSLPRYNEVFLNDLFLYTIINSRPLLLAIMCNIFIKERKKTQSILIHILIHEESSNLYYEQVQTMFLLVESRKLDISAEVFIVNIPIILNFAGKAISYGVLMIQYFYMHH